MATKRLSAAGESMIRWTLVPATVLFLALAGCGDDVTGTGPGEMQAVIFGTVTTAQGDSPIEGAEVVASPFTSNCMEQLVAGSFSAATTDENGEYGQTLTLEDVLGTSFDACLNVDVTPPPGSGLQPTIVQAVEIQFRRVSAIPPMDSARVDAEL